MADPSLDDLAALFSATLALARWSMNKELTFFFGAACSRCRIIPCCRSGGVRWQMQLDWCLTIGFPRTKATYTFDRNTAFFAGVGFEGGSLVSQLSAAVLPEGVTDLLPASLVARPFSPALEQTVLGAGTRLGKTIQNAEIFIRLLREAS